MLATVLLIALTLAHASSDKPVTYADKKEFLERMTRLTTRGEFFTEEAITTAVPHVRVLLALTEKDLGQRDVHPFLALSRGCSSDRKHHSTP